MAEKEQNQQAVEGFPRVGWIGSITLMSHQDTPPQIRIKSPESQKSARTTGTIAPWKLCNLRHRAVSDSEQEARKQFHRILEKNRRNDTAYALARKNLLTNTRMRPLHTQRHYLPNTTPWTITTDNDEFTNKTPAKHRNIFR